MAGMIGKINALSLRDAVTRPDGAYGRYRAREYHDGRRDRLRDYASHRFPAPAAPTKQSAERSDIFDCPEVPPMAEGIGAQDTGIHA